jgi:hypothetical protein
LASRWAAAASSPRIFSPRSPGELAAEPDFSVPATEDVPEAPVADLEVGATDSSFFMTAAGRNRGFPVPATLVADLGGFAPSPPRVSAVREADSGRVRCRGARGGRRSGGVPSGKEELQQFFVCQATVSRDLAQDPPEHSWPKLFLVGHSY